ncbi:Pyrroline-5-carboxylate reductase [Geodia barretti]|uniref:Pyrroline-5-carboxylate reductase n=1 Tax=Geodia barretti TaxID=519541 RepID=A0AA35W423_GEOBA|nr:Pyrroline-5-carboxylate reductase [Geodia barretti]
MRERMFRIPPWLIPCCLQDREEQLGRNGPVHLNHAVSLMDLATMYVMLDALADGGVYAGIPKEIGLRLIAHTMIGAAKMVLENGKHPQELKDDVCSPAGTSIQAIRTLEKAGFRGIVMDAVHAASKRALELSRLDNGETKDVYVKR